MWRLAASNSFRSIEKIFAVIKSTSVGVTNEFCRVIISFSAKNNKDPSDRGRQMKLL